MTEPTAALTGAMVADGTPWLDDVEQAGWRAFVETVFDLQGALEADLAPTGLTLGDYQVLVYLSEAEGHSMRMCDLAGVLQLSPSGLTRRLDGLVRHGDVARVPSALDRRVMLAVLTDTGLRHLEAAAPPHVRSVRSRLFDHVRRDDVEALARIFGAVHAALEADTACTGRTRG